VFRKTLFEAFQHQVHSRPDATALLLDSPQNTACKCSWHALAVVVKHAADRIENQLTRDAALYRRVTHLSDNSDADLVIALASLALGTTEAPLDRRIETTELLRRRKQIGGVWIDDNFKRQLSLKLHDAASQPSTTDTNPVALRDIDEFSFYTRLRQPSEAASLILWTSGTTSEPLAVLLSAESLLSNAAAKLKAVPQEHSDIRLTVLPLSHAYARTCDFGTWLLSGCTLAVCLGYQNMLRRIQHLEPNLINTVPTLARRMLREMPENLSQLRLLGCGGAPLDRSSFKEWNALGVTVIQGYGLTETGPVICSATPSDAAPGLVGKPVDGWETAVKDGQLFVRGPHTMLGYLGQPEATQIRMAADGWLATGDLVERDKTTQQLRVMGRVDDVIVLASGCKLYPAAVERDIEQIDGIQHALLHHGKSLELWLNLDSEIGLKAVQQQALKVLAKRPTAINCTLREFRPSLSIESGELTAKGTIRRGRIIQARLTHQAGS